MDGKEILEKIKEQKIKPKPRWEFLLKNYLVWAVFGLAIIIGSLSTAVIIFMVRHTDWQYYSKQVGLLKELLINLPYFWVITLIAFIALALYNLKHTKKGYKYNPLLTVTVSIIISVLFGSVIYAFGGGEKLEDIFYRRVPFYQQIMRFRGHMLLNPDQGMIPGIITQISNNAITITDFHGKIWQINTSTDEFNLGQRVMLIGKKMSEEKFEGTMLKPWFRPQHPRINNINPPMPGERKF